MATPPKPPKDPKPAARRAPRKAPASSTARRAAAAPPKQVEPKAEAPKAAAKSPKAPTAAKRAPAAPRAKAATPRATAKPRSPVETVTAAAASVTRAVPDTVSRNAWTIGALVAAAGAGIAAFLTRGRIASVLKAGVPGSSEGHVPTDLTDTGGDSLTRQGGERAIPAFRPDMDAAMTAAEREALRPATGPAPSLAAERGTMNAQTGPAD